MHNQRLTLHPLLEGDQVVPLQLEAPTRERTFNNLWSVSLVERFRKKTLQMRWTPAATLLQLNKKSETVLPLCIILAPQLMLQLRLPVVQQMIQEMRVLM